jgi:hypothetical protein
MVLESQSHNMLFRTIRNFHVFQLMYTISKHVSNNDILMTSAFYFTYQCLVLSLHDVEEMNGCKADHVCLSSCLYAFLIQLQNRWTDLDYIWFGGYSTGGYRKIILINFLRWLIPT